LKQTSVYTPPVASESEEDSKSGQDEPVEDEETSAAPVDYELISIVSPDNNQVMRSTDGQADISIELRPGLQSGHKIRIYLDGTQTANDLETTQITLQNIDRGTHSLEVSVIAKNDKEVLRSSAVTFHMLRLAEPKTAPFEGNLNDG